MQAEPLVPPPEDEQDGRWRREEDGSEMRRLGVRMKTTNRRMRWAGDMGEATEKGKMENT